MQHSIISGGVYLCGPFAVGIGIVALVIIILHRVLHIQNFTINHITQHMLAHMVILVDVGQYAFKRAITTQEIDEISPGCRRLVDSAKAVRS